MDKRFNGRKQRPMACALLMSLAIHGVLIWGLGQVWLASHKVTPFTQLVSLRIEMAALAPQEAQTFLQPRPPKILVVSRPAATLPSPVQNPVVENQVSAVVLGHDESVMRLDQKILPKPKPKPKLTPFSNIPLHRVDAILSHDAKPASMTLPRVQHASEEALTAPVERGYLLPSYAPKPKYPVLARRSGIEGVVTLRIHIDALGKPDQIKIRKTSGYRMLDRAAKHAVSLWRFESHGSQMKSNRRWLDLPIRFQLN